MMDSYLCKQFVEFQLETKIKRIYSQHRQKESDIYHVKYTLGQKFCKVS